MVWLSPITDVFEFIFPFLDSVPVIRMIIGFVLVFFLPGFAWSFVFFNRIKVIERVLLSFALSMALVTLSLLFASWLLKIKLTGPNSILIIILVTIIPIGIRYLVRFLRKKPDAEDDDEEESTEEDEMLERYD